MKILIAKSIFIPSHGFMESNKRSIEQFIAMIESANGQYNFCFQLIGWITPKLTQDETRIFVEYLEELRTRLEEMSQTRDGEIYFNYEIWGHNLGKKYLLRNISQLCPHSRTANVIIYADHDVGPIDNILISRMALGTQFSGKEVALIGFTQTTNDQNNPRVYMNTLEILGNQFHHSDHLTDIASGCFMTLPEYLNVFNLRDTEYVYGDEDILISESLNKRSFVSVVSDQKVEHQIDTDNTYLEWKKDIIFRIVTGKEIPMIDYWADNE